MPPRAALVVTGDEVLRGAVTDLNSAFLADQLERAGVPVERVEIIPDDMAAIRGAVEGNLAAGVDVIITTGGLGGTHDDLTMAAVAEACGRPLKLRDDAYQLVHGVYEARGRVEGVSARTQKAFEEKQASLPEGATMILPAGTAPGCVIECGGSLVVVLPGPPSELRRMWATAGRLPPLSGALRAGARLERRTLRLVGIVENQFTDVFDRIPAGLVQALDIGVCARDGELEVHVAGEDARAIDAVQTTLADFFGEALYSTDGADVVETVTALLRSRGEMVAVAESCTGGGLGALLTSRGGASTVFLGGVIAYGNGVKEAALGVSGDVISEHGAVSAEAAGAMAEGVIRVTGSDWGLSTTGIAGPAGGTDDKPVGLVYVGVVGPGYENILELHLRGTRDQIRSRTSARALHGLRAAIAGLED